MESAQKCAANLCKAHENALKSYRELRDSKNEEIECLHREIEVLKEMRAEDARQIKRLRQAVKFYEKERSKDGNRELIS